MDIQSLETLIAVVNSIAPCVSVPVLADLRARGEETAALERLAHCVASSISDIRSKYEGNELGRPAIRNLLLSLMQLSDALKACQQRKRFSHDIVEKPALQLLAELGIPAPPGGWKAWEAAAPEED